MPCMQLSPSYILPFFCFIITWLLFSSLFTQKMEPSHVKYRCQSNPQLCAYYYQQFSFCNLNALLCRKKNVPAPKVASLAIPLNRMSVPFYTFSPESTLPVLAKVMVVELWSEQNETVFLNVTFSTKLSSFGLKLAILLQQKLIKTNNGNACQTASMQNTN